MYLDIQSPNPHKKMEIYTGGAVFKGCVAVLSGTTAVLGAAGISTSAATILGIFAEDADSGAKSYVKPLDDNGTIEGLYTGSTKTSLTDADLGKLIDIVVSTTTTTNDTQKFNLDDLAGPFMIVAYDNYKKKVWVKAAHGARYV